MNTSVTRIKNSLAPHKSFFPMKASVLESFPHKLAGAVSRKCSAVEYFKIKIIQSLFHMFEMLSKFCSHKKANLYDTIRSKHRRRDFYEL